MNVEYIYEFYSNDILFLKQKGGLEGEYSNILDHCIFEAVVAWHLADAVSGKPAFKNALVRAALLHDWYKRKEIEGRKKYGDRFILSSSFFSYEGLCQHLGTEKRIAEIASCVMPDFSDADGDDIYTSDHLASICMHWIDGSVLGNELVGYKQRIEKTKDRYTYIAGLQISGISYFKYEEKVCKKIEEKILQHIKCKNWNKVLYLRDFLNEEIKKSATIDADKKEILNSPNYCIGTAEIANIESGNTSAVGSMIESEKFTHVNFNIIQVSPAVIPGEFYAGGVALGHSSFNLDWMAELGIPEPKLIFDIGAYDGGDAIRFQQRWPGAKVFSFEADPFRFGKMMMSRLCDVLNLPISFFQLAISNVRGSVDFYPSLCMLKDAGDTHSKGEPGGQGSMYRHSEVYKNTYKHIVQYEKPIKVFSDRLDNIFYENKISLQEVDLLHIDVEGSEYEVIQGLSMYKPKVIFVETLEGMFEGAKSKWDLDNLLINKGYQLVGDFVSDRLYKYHSV